MELNKLAISTIESNYIKQYLNSINHVFSLDEQITLIFNSNLTIDDKLDIYIQYLDNLDRNINYSDNDKTVSRQFISFIIEKIYTLKSWIESNEYTVMFSGNNYNTVCCSSLDRFKEIATEKYKYDDTDNYSVYLCDSKTADIAVRLELNKEFKIINYSFTDDNMYCGIENKYIDIPNDIHVGDKVRLTGDDSIYIVISDSTIPEELKSKSEFSTDICVTVVPEYVFENKSNYKEQIDSIIHNRIEKLQNSNNDTDILMDEHEYFHVLYLEKELN